MTAGMVAFAARRDTLVCRGSADQGSSPVRPRGAAGESRSRRDESALEVAMSTTETRGDRSGAASTETVDMKLEVIIIPVSDLDRATDFYRRLGWRFDGDFVDEQGAHSVQLTPPGSSCSVQFGTGMTPVAPGSAQGMHLVVSDIEAARARLVESGADASPVYHCESGYACRYPGHGGRVDGRHPEGGTYGSFVSFTDPDGNGWVLQEVTARFPGRVEGATAYTSVSDLAQALRRAAAAEGGHEATEGAAPDWADRYARHMMQEQSGQAAQRS
jgi:catechol 2,3-dioxygenase-like lactoylglutathione lyase family enzyme